MPTHIPSTGFLRLPQIMELVPVSKSAWWEGCRTGRFPKPVKIGPQIDRQTSCPEGGPTTLKDMVKANHDYRGEW